MEHPSTFRGERPTNQILGVVIFALNVFKEGEVNFLCQKPCIFGSDTRGSLNFFKTLLIPNLPNMLDNRSKNNRPLNTFPFFFPFLFMVSKEPIMEIVNLGVRCPVVS